jgi:hypothetical protein
VGVVDVLEPVHVEEQDAHVRAGTPGRDHRVGGTTLELAPVRQTRQLIEARPLVQVALLADHRRSREQQQRHGEQEDDHVEGELVAREVHAVGARRDDVDLGSDRQRYDRLTDPAVDRETFRPLRRPADRSPP